MGKSKHIDDANTALLINFDKTYRMVDARNIKKHLLNDTNKIERILIPVSKYDSVNYYMVDVHMYPLDIEHFEIIGSFALEGFECGWGSNENSMNVYEPVSTIHLSTNDTNGIYNMYESLSVIAYVNEIINPAYNDDFYLFSFDNPRFTIKKRDFECVNERINKDECKISYPSDNHGSIARAVDTLIKMVFANKKGVSGSFKLINTDYSIITISNGHCKFFEYGVGIKEILNRPKYLNGSDSIVGVFSPSVGTYTFLNSIDYILLSNLDSMQFQIYFYEIADGVDEVTCEHVTSSMLDEFSDLFTEDFQLVTDLYGIEYLVQLLANFRCIANYVKLFGDICFGFATDDILFSIVGIVDTDKLPFNVSQRCSKRYEYRYEITFSKLNEVNDFVSDFISKLIKELSY